MINQSRSETYGILSPNGISSAIGTRINPADVASMQQKENDAVLVRAQQQQRSYEFMNIVQGLESTRMRLMDMSYVDPQNRLDSLITDIIKQWLKERPGV